jgi:hypothetical protein
LLNFVQKYEHNTCGELVVFPEGICVETRDFDGIRASLLYRRDSALISGVIMEFMKRNEILVLV